MYAPPPRQSRRKTHDVYQQRQRGANTPSPGKEPEQKNVHLKRATHANLYWRKRSSVKGAMALMVHSCPSSVADENQSASLISISFWLKTERGWYVGLLQFFNK